MSTTISYSTLSRQDSTATNAIIDHFTSTSSAQFDALGEFQAKSILQRDMEDGVKLQQGIDLAVNKGVLDQLDSAKASEEYQKIDVFGKTPDEVADEIWARVKDKAETEGGGGLIILSGLSGTGKGTTFAKLGEKLRASDDVGQVVNWSNGNLFRSVTLLATKWCEQQNLPFDADKALTKENLESFMKMLQFGKFNDKYDTHIQGLGVDTYISEIENTVLKQPSVGKNIPTVAAVTQGEIVQFARSAMELMKSNGIMVLLEGREQTLNYIPTKHKFTLIMSDEALIGKRRAAQRLMAASLKKLDESAEDSEVERVLEEELSNMVKEMEN
eukprot:CAMPEP_0195524172 /NCGR_PEP_ID=MMETSP0794_2-20130614/23857_1 /TAXON_ID=515487 /ORGANISM="Stephanopyxis turris, Strain CCMP 815" /LENGTH=328 /DNA_ID=CAMNT_0040654339 /DNA_START=355 /DNA_END=1341 /DNA_ORIENTATION=+